MKLFKFSIPFFPLLFLSLPLFFPARLPTTPITSEKSNYLHQLQQFFNSTSYQLNHLQYYNYRQEIEFDLSSADSSTHVIFPTTQNTYQLVFLLQNTLKKAKIEEKDVQFIDLSTPLPYATLQNN